MATWTTKVDGEKIAAAYINDLQTIKVDNDCSEWVNLVGQDQAVKTTDSPKFMDIISGDVDRAFDNFFRSDRLLQGDIAPSGHTWWLTGAGAATATITDYKMTVTGNAYAYLMFGRTVNKIEGVFSFSPNGTGIAMILDHSNDLQSMLHLNIYPTSWVLTKRVSGEAAPWAEVLYGFYNLLTDGTQYRFSISISGNTVTVVAPDGTIQSATDADIGTIDPQNGCWQIQGVNDNYGTWHMVSIGDTKETERTTLGGAAPLGEVAWLKGTYEKGNYLQRITFTTPATSGWYRISTAGVLKTYCIIGEFTISAKDLYYGQIWRLFANCIYNDAAPQLVSFLGGSYGGANPIDQVRLSTDSTGLAIGLDVHLSADRAAEVTVDFKGVFTPVASPTVGATVLPTGSQIRSFMENTADIDVAKVGGGTRTLNFVGGIYVGYADS